MVRVLDHYGLLGIPVNSSTAVIKKVYKTLALKHHPDKNPDNINAQKNFQMLQGAYAVLTDISARRIYDRARILDGFIPSNFLPSTTKEAIEEEHRKAVLLAAKNKLAKEEISRAKNARLEKEKNQKTRANAEYIYRREEQFHAERKARAEKSESDRRRQERLAADAAEKLRAAQAKRQEPGNAWQQKFYEERWEDEARTKYDSKTKAKLEKQKQQKQERENMERASQEKNKHDNNKERFSREKSEEKRQSTFEHEKAKRAKEAEEDMSKWWEEEMDKVAREKAEREKRGWGGWNRFFQGEQDIDMKDWVEEDESLFGTAFGIS